MYVNKTGDIEPSVGVGGMRSKKGHVIKFLRGPPHIEVLLVLTSKSKIITKLVKNSSVGAILKSRQWKSHQKCLILKD